MRPPRLPLVPLAAALAVAAAAIAGTAGDAQADLGVPLPSLSPLPTVTLPSLPLPTGSVSVPPPPSASLPGSTPLPTGTGAAGGGSGSGTGSDTTPTGTSADGGPTAGAAGTTTRAARTKAARDKADATPMVAGSPAAENLVDDESSPQLRRAGEQFLAADEGIAEIARQKRVLVRLKQDAADTAQLYRAMGYDVDGAERVATGWHARYDGLAADTSDRQRGVVGDSSTRADERLGELVVGRAQVKAEFEQIAARYQLAKQALADASARLQSLAAQRSTALTAVQAARGSDLALYQARVLESGQLGQQIEALSVQLARRGDTVQGSGTLAHPLAGIITSPFGMRFHPILHYTKLHTGTDFAGGSIIHAADDGRVLMTVVSTAYGNFTVIDHGMVDGKRVTTAYAHQAQFLVTPGQRVSKGDPIGIVGATGYATGPHLHFEVRENGTVVDPMTYLR